MTALTLLPAYNLRLKGNHNISHKYIFYLPPSHCLFLFFLYLSLSVSVALCMSLPPSYSICLCLSVSPFISLYLSLSVSFSLSLSLSLGSSDTIAASAFALSIFSLLLQYSHKKIVTILLVFLKESSKNQESLTFEEVLDSEIAMTELLRSATSTDLDASSNEKPLTQPPTQQLESPKLSPKIDTHAKKPSANTIKTSLPGSGKSKLTKQGKDRKATKKKKLIDRRRRKKVKGKGESSSEGSGSESDGSSHSSDASLSPLENLGEDIDLDMIDSLSESSSDSEEDKWKDHKPTDKQTKEKPVQCSSLAKSSPKSTGSKSRRQIVLAANFSLSRPGVEKTSIDDEVLIVS